jgi:4-hydroxythreonine-4-phosphate dehydrogenase
MSIDKTKMVVGITMGDPAGIGAEIIAKALKRTEIRKLANFLVIGDKWVFEKNQKSKIKNQKFKFINLNNMPRRNFAFGKVKAEYGRASLEYLNTAIFLINKRVLDCLVTAPVNKEAINLSGTKFSGHTEYLAKKFGAKDFLMMFVAEKLKVSLVTRHMPLAKVARNLKAKDIFKSIIMTAESLKKYFGIKKPRIAVCGLNPHAGEAGNLGREEKKIIHPALKKAKKKFKNIFGPLPSETVFHDALKEKYDAVIAMYHDQGLIPFKMLYRDKGVNITFGLPFIRTSPDHGTGFDIAGQNKANPSSMIEAIKLAIRCTRRVKKV